MCFPRKSKWGRLGEIQMSQAQKKKLEEAEKIIMYKVKEQHMKTYEGLKMRVEKRVDTLKEQEVRVKLQAEAEAQPRGGLLGRLFI